MNRNGNIDLASLDRVSETRESYTRDPGNGPWYRVTESIAYLQSGAATPTVLSTTKEQLTGFTGNVVARRIVIGASGQATTYTTTIDRAAKTRTESIQRPGVAGAETRVFVNGALRSESTPGQSGTVIYTYDGVGRIATVAHPATGTTTYQYRGEGTLVESVTNHLGHVTRYAYYTSGPLAGQVQTMTNPELETVTYSYDIQNRQVTESGTGTYPVTKIYNEEGQMTELHTFRNNLTTPDITKWHYDPASGLLEAKEYADHSTVLYTYDAAGRLTSRTWARGVRTIYAYDPATGDLKSISYSDGTPGVTFTNRDRLGRIDTLTDAIGAQNLDFDAEGTLTSHAYTDGALAGIALTIGRDGLGRRSGLSVTRNGNTIHSVAEGYDQFGRLSTHSFGGRTITYGYDPARGLRTETRFPSGVTTTTAYDSAGRISSVLSAKNGQVLAGRTYTVIDKANRRKQIGEPDGSSWTYDYNTRGEVIRGEKQGPAGNLLDGHRFTYQYDQIGNRITATTGAPDLVASYATNALNQYTQITTPQTEFVRGTAQGATSVTVNGQAIALGPNGSFNARVTGSGPAAIVATAADGSTSTETRTVALPPATFAPQYDADGNLLNDGLWAYTWDGENRLIALESTPTNPMPERIFKRFTYDYQSRRVSEERHVFNPAAGTGGARAYVLEKAIRWVNDGWNQSVELLNDRPVRAYVWGLDLSGTRDGAGGVGGLISSVDLLGGDRWDYLYDGNGNIVGLADSTSGAVVAEYAYGPFGEELAISSKEARLNKLRFSTKMSDHETGSSYYGYRSYHTEIGRWASRDPIGEYGGLSIYGFLSNHPQTAVDAYGLKPLEITLLVFIDPEARRYQKHPIVDHLEKVTHGRGVIENRPVYRTDANGAVITENLLRDRVLKQVEVLNQVLAKCKCASMIAKLEFAGEIDDLDLRFHENRTERIAAAAALIERQVAGRSGVPVVVTGKYSPNYTTANSESKEPEGTSVQRPIFPTSRDPWALPYAPLTGGVIVRVNGQEPTLAHELGHYVGWFTKDRPMIWNGKKEYTHISDPAHVMDYQNGTNPDELYCELMMQLAQQMAAAKAK